MRFLIFLYPDNDLDIQKESAAMNNGFMKYTNSYNWGWKILSILIAALLAFALVWGLCGNYIDYARLPVFAIILLLTLIPALRTGKFRRRLKESNMTEEAESDFNDAIAFRNGRLRMGKKWIYIKGKCRMVAYSDIRQVYQHITKRYFIETERELRYVDTDGRKRIMCRLELRGRSDEEVKQIVTLMLINNPTIKVGYK